MIGGEQEQSENVAVPRCRTHFYARREERFLCSKIVLEFYEAAETANARSGLVTTEVLLDIFDALPISRTIHRRRTSSRVLRYM